MTQDLQLKKLLIQTKKQVFSEIIGNNTSKLKGEGYDFLELKEYEYGEDAKNIDWVISAKLQKPYVKVFNAQKELNIHIVPILTGSMHFGTAQLKQHVLTQICATLGFSSMKQGDPFCSYFANETLELCTPPSKRMHSVYQMAESLFHYDCIGKSVQYHSLMQQVYDRIKKRSIIFLIGDFMDVSTLDLRLLCQKHEVFVIVLRDKFEENPQELGNVNFIDPSDFFNFQGNINAHSIKNYQELLHKNDHAFYGHLQKCGVRFTKILTHESVISKLIGLLKS